MLGSPLEGHHSARCPSSICQEQKIHSPKGERVYCLSTVPCAVDHHEHNRKLQIQHLHSSRPVADGQNLAAPHGQEIRCPQALRACASHRKGEAKAPQVTANCAMGPPLSPTMPWCHQDRQTGLCHLMGVIYSRWQEDKSSKLKITPKPQHKFHLTAGSQHSNGGGSRTAAVVLGLLLKDEEDRKKIPVRCGVVHSLE